MTRRDLITTAGAAAMTAASQARVLGANNRMSIALIGCGARGNQLLPHFQKLNEAPLTAVCDVYRARAEKSQALAPGAKLFGDHRKLLEMPGLDAVVIATPDHWHAAIAIDAPQRRRKDASTSRSRSRSGWKKGRRSSAPRA